MHFRMNRGVFLVHHVGNIEMKEIWSAYFYVNMTVFNPTDKIRLCYETEYVYIRMNIVNNSNIR